MKTTFIKKIATLALSAFALGSFAQCPTMSGIYVQSGTGTATVAAMMTPSTSVGTGYFNWTVSPAAYTTPISGTNNSMQSLAFSATGVYTVCAYYTDSTTMCSASTCTTITVTSTVSANCNAAFSVSTNSTNCWTYFTNASTGVNLSYKWYQLPGMTLMSTMANPAFTLGNGSHTIALYTYSNGMFCDSAVSTINVSCGTSTVCNASFTHSTSSCVTNFYSTSTGTNLTYEWRNMNTFPFPVISTQSSFTTSLPAGNNTIALYTYSNGQFCDSTVHTVAGCPTNTCQVNSQFSVFADSVNAGNYFAYNQSTGTGSLTYLWDFGDGNTSTQAYPFHQYATPGQYIICLTATSTSGSITCSDVSCDSSSVHRIAAGYLMNRIQVMASPTAIKEQQVLKNLSVYPNPVEIELTIEIELTTEKQQLNYVITDALGKVVAKNELTSSKTVVNTATLDRGVYFLSVSGNDKVLKTTKLVK
jgi:hypothetical protein